jgi:hypothetical protein
MNCFGLRGSIANADEAAVVNNRRARRSLLGIVAMKVLFFVAIKLYGRRDLRQRETLNFPLVKARKFKEIGTRTYTRLHSYRPN